MEQSIIMWGTIVIYNLAIVQLLRVTLAGADFKEATTEKAAPAQPPPPQNPPLVAGDQVAQPDDRTEPPTSYSRVAGMIGAVVIACFVWAVGNILLYKLITSPNEVATMTASLGTYFLAAASLFAPYAVNQLGNAFRTK